LWFAWHISEKNIVVKAMLSDQDYQSVHINKDQLPIPFKTLLNVTPG
jgi:hypothetical protein